ncbi:hypothetical protein [Anaerosporobacter sp.]|uniref:hypothetical protein n=1 Tax=Anaerosporobacter sp. TaxID=1872529 RepID=UPI00286F9BC1|nr:hypothetical protein [Anaerosporobacter sp.]
MVAKKKFIIVGIVILAMVAIIGIVALYHFKDKTDYVFGGTFVNAEEIMEVADVSQPNDEDDKSDCFKRKVGDCAFI